MNLQISWIPLGTLIVAIAGFVVATLKGASELSASTKQRKIDLQWKRVNTAREMLSEIHQNPLSGSAVTIMDWSSGSHNYKIDGKDHRISYDHALSVLNAPRGHCTEPEDEFVQDSFDWFFYEVDRIEHYIRTDLISWEDVEPVFKPYAIRVRENQSTFDRFMADHYYDLAKEFWTRYKT